MPNGMRLWSPMFGVVEFTRVNEDNTIDVSYHYKGVSEWRFKGNGRTYYAPDTAEVCLFPSKLMRDWDKITWKRGVVLNDGESMFVFDKWGNEEYTTIVAKHSISLSNNQLYRKEITAKTCYCKLMQNNEAYLKVFDTHFPNCKINPKTLEIEKPEPQFKDGDILTLDADGNFAKTIFIMKNLGNNYYSAYAFYNATGQFVKLSSILADRRKNFRPATDSEKQQLFNALAEEGKRWNAETKTLEDLPKKYEFKAFDKVLVRQKENDEWRISLFSHYTNGIFPYFCLNATYKCCLPYNEQTKHLLGTTDDYQEGGKE